MGHREEELGCFFFGIDWVMAFHFESIKLLFLSIKKKVMAVTWIDILQVICWWPFQNP